MSIKRHTFMPLKHTFLLVLFIVLGICGVLVYTAITHRSPFPQASAYNNSEFAANTTSTSASTTPDIASNSTASSEAQITHGPIISIDFDDGFASAYQNALPIIHAAGFKTTQYIITHALGEKSYVTAQDVLAMQAAGDEIGAHTQTHPHLTKIPLAQAEAEIENSKQDLLNMGIKSVTTFAYPYGLHNAALENVVKQDGFEGARITWPGFNDHTTDLYALRYFGISGSTTISQVEQAIDTVAANKKWLILVFHRVDESTSDSENTTHELIQAVVDYIRQKNIPVVTNAEGLQILKNIQ